MFQCTQIKSPSNRRCPHTLETLWKSFDAKHTSHYASSPPEVFIREVFAFCWFNISFSSSPITSSKDSVLVFFSHWLLFAFSYSMFVPPVLVELFSSHCTSVWLVQNPCSGEADYVWWDYFCASDCIKILCCGCVRRNCKRCPSLWLTPLVTCQLCVCAPHRAGQHG